MPEPEKRLLVAVYAAPNQFVAELVRGRLEAEGIPAVIGERVTAAYAPLLQLAEGYWGEVCVPADFETQARALVEDWEAGQDEISEEELEAAALRSPQDGETTGH